MAVVTVGQLLYPSDRALPFARLGGRAVGWQTELELAKRLGEDFVESRLIFQNQGMPLGEATLISAGAEVQEDVLIRRLTDYPLWQRLVPGSFFWQRPEVKQWSISFNNKVLDAFSVSRAAFLSRPATNASLAIVDGEVVAISDVPGVLFTPAQITEALTEKGLSYGREVVVELRGWPIRPDKTAADFFEIRSQAELALNRQIEIVANGQTFTPSREDRASWLELIEGVGGRAILKLNTKIVQEYIDQVVNKQAGKGRGTTSVTLQNGYELKREVGESGLAVDKEDLIESIDEYLIEGIGDGRLLASMIDVAPLIVYNSTYTATRDGLQAYISDRAKRGAWISIQQLDGERWAVGADDHDSVVSASTYKLYVSLYLFKEMQEGKRDWSTPIIGTDTSTCFDRMTIASTNACAEEWLNQFGRTNLNNFLYEKGFSRATTFTNPRAAHTSSADLTRFMAGLEQGTLVSGAYRDRLLSSLSRHSYRSGIPAGSAGRVWNKVGFLWSYTHDTAIVHHPRGRYVMTIMTTGQSYAAIANMTREIEKIMYP